MEQNTEKFSIPNSQFSILTSYFPDLTDRQKSNTPPYMTYIRIGTPRST